MKFANIEIETLDYHTEYVPMDEPLPNFVYPPGVTDYGMYYLMEREFYTIEKRVFNTLQGRMVIPVRPQNSPGMTTLFKKI